MVTYLSLKEKFEAKVGTEDRESQRSQGLSSLILPQPEDQAHHSALGCIITYTHPTPSLTPALFMASAPHNSLVSRQQHKGKVERGAREAQMELAVTQSNPVPGGGGGGMATRGGHLARSGGKGQRLGNMASITIVLISPGIGGERWISRTPEKTERHREKRAPKGTERGARR